MSQLPANEQAVALGGLQGTALAEQAVRLRRQKWRDPDQLAQELYLMLCQDTAPTTGTVTIDPGDGTTADPQPPAWPDPFGGFQFPDLFLPDLQGQDAPVVDDVPNEDPAPGLPAVKPPTRRRRKKVTTTRHLRAMVPGKVTGGEGASYQVDLYPNGSTATDAEGEPVRRSVEGVRQLQIADGETIPAGTWALVFWHVEAEVTVTTLTESGGGTQGQRVVSKSTKVRVVREDFEMQVSVWLSDAGS